MTATPSESVVNKAIINPMLGIGFMVAAMLIIPVVDGTAKYLSSAHSPLFLSWARYAFAVLIVLPVAFYKHRSRFLPRSHLGAHFLRTIFLMAAMTCYFVSISLIPMATAISAFFVGPIIATLLAVFILGERLTLKKVLALILGFSGALLIVRPDMDFDPAILLALASGVLFGFYIVATRQASQNSDPLKTLAFQCLVGTIILTPQAIWFWSWPTYDQLYLFAGMGLFSAFSHFLSIAAFRKAEASILAPLVYVELIGTAAIGFIIFGEVPGLTVWIGAGVIVAGGLVLIGRTRSENSS